MSDQRDKPVFDEQTLARVLEAAYVLQEHSRALELNLDLQSDQLRAEQAQTATPPRPPQLVPQDKSSSKDDDYTLILAQIVETQHQIQVRQLELQSALALVAERLTQFTGASGAAVGIVEGKIVAYQAGSGTSALPRGSKLPMEKALCFTSLRTGQVMRCADVNPEFLIDAEECHRRGIQSLISVPVYHEGGIAGALELYFDTVDAFNDQDVHSCQLMAGLVTEALARDAQLTWKKSLAAEHANMLEALERLKPGLTPTAQARAQGEAGTKDVASVPLAGRTFVCRKCGHSLVGEEQFCGNCGTPRVSDHEPPTLQSKVASLWMMKEGGTTVPQPLHGIAETAAPQGNQKAAEQDIDEVDSPQRDLSSEEDRQRELARLLANTVPDFSVTHDPADVEQLGAHASGVAGNPSTLAENSVEKVEILDLFVPEAIGTESEDSETLSSEAALQKTAQDTTWTSAVNARDFLEQAAQSHAHSAFQRFWNMRRGDVYLAIAVILMAIVIRWGIWSDQAGGAAGSGVTNTASHRKPEADLSMLDRLLISTGLAEPPDKPEPKGNPDTQVWVDLHTALYYCPGTDLYGKTPKGRFTSQKDAQLDQFEPAYRKTCD